MLAVPFSIPVFLSRVVHLSASFCWSFNSLSLVPDVCGVRKRQDRRLQNTEIDLTNAQHTCRFGTDCALTTQSYNCTSFNR